MSDAACPLSGDPCPASGDACPVSGDPCPVSGVRRVLSGAVVAAAILACGTARADDAPPPDPLVLHAEVDPFPFSTGRYGGQIGIRHPALHGVRIAVASFSLDVPDLIGQLGGNDKFHVDVRPSGAIYVLYYLRPAGRDGLAIGGSIRYLRFRYTNDDAPGERADVSEISPEAIVGYQWHPFHEGTARGFYLQPWLALGRALTHSGDMVVGGREYKELPISPFFTVNIGWEQAF